MKKLLSAFLCVVVFAIPVRAEESPTEANLYAQAMALEEAGDYSGAISCYAELGDYLDSREKYVQLLPHTAHQVRGYDDGVAAFEAGGKWGLLNAEGVVILPPTWYKIDSFHEGRAVVLRRDEQYRRYYDIIDTQGHVIRKSDSPIDAYSDWEDMSYFRYNKSGLAAICRNGKWGFIDRNGNTVIEPIYYDPESTLGYNPNPFENGAEWLLEGRSVPGKNLTFEGTWRYIDTEGNILLENQYQDVRTFSEGLAAVKADGKYGFIDETGYMAIEPRWDWTLPFQNGTAIVWDGDKQGVIDKQGHTIIEPVWDDVARGPDGRFFAVFIGEWDEWGEDYGRGEFGFFDAEGNIVWEPQWRIPSDWGILRLDTELIAVRQEHKKWGGLNQNLELVIPLEWEGLTFFFGNEDVGIGAKDGKGYFLDLSGNILFENVWEKTGDGFVSGRMSIFDGKQYGYVNPAGEMVIYGWDAATDFSENGVAVVGQYTLDEYGESVYREYVIDANGMIVSDCEWVSISDMSSVSKWFNGDSELARAMAADGKWGYIDKATGTTKVKPVWDEAESFSEGLAFVKKDGYWYVIDEYGNVVY